MGGSIARLPNQHIVVFGGLPWRPDVMLHNWPPSAVRFTNSYTVAITVDTALSVPSPVQAVTPLTCPLCYRGADFVA